ncbi:MAG: DUF6062 family protein [Anaerolineae bacterium]|nr:DUF6062 family protein [Anaerolineae bacterium]
MPQEQAIGEPQAVSTGRFSMISADLKRALRLQGCAVCRLKEETVHRYVRFLLAENVNDGDARAYIVHGLGFCPEHTWLLYHTETTRFGDALGNSILYEDLAERVRDDLVAFRRGLPTSASRPNVWWRRAWGRFRLVVGSLIRHPGALDPLRPVGECRMCAHAAHEEETVVRALVSLCDAPDFRALYTASDGLCLAHLRQALRLAATHDPDTARFLADEATGRLETLVANLGAYIRKQAWQYRDEPLTSGEADAPRKAAEFFGGREMTTPSAPCAPDGGNADPG